MPAWRACRHKVLWWELVLTVHPARRAAAAPALTLRSSLLASFVRRPQLSATSCMVVLSLVPFGLARPFPSCQGFVRCTSKWGGLVLPWDEVPGVLFWLESQK